MTHRRPRLAALVLLAGACTADGPDVEPDAAPDVDAGLTEDGVPEVWFGYSYGLDDFCPRQTVPESLTDWQLALIDRIPAYREALLAELPAFQASWDAAAMELLPATVQGGEQGFARREHDVALFLCPRLPSMGTPLAVNVLSYLEAAVVDIPTLTDLDGDGDRDPLPRSLFVAITYHELLHRYLADLPGLASSPVLASLPASLTADLAPRDAALLRAHLHLFALRRWVYEDVGLDDQLPLVAALERSHGAGYRRAWELVHDRTDYYEPLLLEIRGSDAGR